MGLATAYHLAKATDREILILDRYGIPNEYSSSNDINRVFRYSYGSDKLYIQMAIKSLELWKQLEQESGENLLTPTGLLLLYGDDENSNRFCDATYKTLTELELGAEKLAQRDLAKRFPQFHSDQAILDPHGGVLLASRVLAALEKLVVRLGVKVQRGQAKEIVQSDKPHLTMRNDQEIYFEKIVVTTGSWSNSLLKDNLVRVSPTRQQLIYLWPAHGLEQFLPKSCPVFFTDKHYGLPAAGIDGVKISAKELQELVDPDAAKRTIDDQQIQECREACRKFIPSLEDAEVVRSKVCIYDMTPNSDFVMDLDPSNSDMVYGYGFSGHGFKFAPLIGKLLAQLVLDQKPSIDLDTFSALPSERRPATIGAHLGKGE